MTDVKMPSMTGASPDTTQLLRDAMSALRMGDIVKSAELADLARQQDQSARVMMVFAAISHALGRDVDALSILEQAIKLAPDIGNYPDAAASILLKLGRKADGMFNLKLGTHLPSDPFIDEIIGDYFGNIKDIFDSFIENRPLTTARLMVDQRLYAAAIHHLEIYIGVSGGDAESFALLAYCTLQIGAIQDAEIALTALTALAPSYRKLVDYKIGLALLKGEVSEIKTLINQLPPVTSVADALERYRLLVYSPFIEASVLLNVRDEINKLVTVNTDVDPFELNLSPERIIGFVCADIDSALESILLAMKSRCVVKVYILGTGGSRSLQRIKASLDDVREVAMIDDATLIEMIRLDGISVLFDCVGAGHFARPNIWRTKMAPIQILWAFTDPYDDTISYTYKLAADKTIAQDDRTFDIGMPIRYPIPPAELMGQISDIRSMNVTRDADGKESKRLLVPHPVGLLTNDIIDLYLSILDEVSGAVLAFVARPDLSDPLVHRVLTIADQRGCADRIDLIAPVDFAKSRHEIMLDSDLILDSAPYGNLDLVTECLWIGCPVLILDGLGVREHASAAMAQAGGLHQLVAKDVGEFRQKAVTLLKKPNALSELKVALLDSQKGLTLERYDAVAEALIAKLGSLWDARWSMIS